MHSKHTLPMMAQIEEVTNACELRSSNATYAGLHQINLFLCSNFSENLSCLYVYMQIVHHMAY